MNRRQLTSTSTNRLVRKDDESLDHVPPLPRRPYSSMSAGSIHYSSRDPPRPTSALSTGSDDAIRRKELNEKRAEERRIKATSVISPLSRARQQGIVVESAATRKKVDPKKDGSKVDVGKVRKPRPQSFHAGMQAAQFAPSNTQPRHRRTTSSNSSATTSSSVSLPPTPNNEMRVQKRKVRMSQAVNVTPPRTPIAARYEEVRMEPLGARDPAVEARCFAKRMVELDSYYGIGKLG